MIKSEKKWLGNIGKVVLEGKKKNIPDTCMENVFKDFIYNPNEKNTKAAKTAPDSKGLICVK